MLPLPDFVQLPFLCGSNIIINSTTVNITDVHPVFDKLSCNVGSVDFPNAKNSNTVSTTREMLDRHGASLSDQHSAGFRAHRISMAAWFQG